MKRSIVFAIFFIISIFIFLTCESGCFFSFFYTAKEGDDYYHSRVTENILIFNYTENIKAINYCFTDEDSCNDYLVYDGELSKRILNIAIDYPDSNDGMRICVNIVSSNTNSVHCNDLVYVVDSLSPVINPLYDEIILNGKDDKLENLFEVLSNTGIKDFSCDYVDSAEHVYTIECKAIGNNTLETTYTKKVYVTDSNDLEGKSILFVGDNITEASSKYGISHFSHILRVS